MARVFPEIMAGTLILFIHGLGGKAEATWGRFAELIAADPELKDFATAFYSFPTSLFRLPFSKKYAKIQTLADAVRTELDVRNANYKNVILVCHSLGGLIGRRYLIDEVKRKVSLRVSGLLLYAVPHNGAGLAAVSAFISWRHNQLVQLTKSSDLLRDLTSDWQVSAMDTKLSVRYVVGAVDRVVSEESARSSWGNMNVDVIADRGHVDLVKPKDASDVSYLILKKFALARAPLVTPDPVKVIQRYAHGSAATEPPKPATRKGYRVIAFDFDGTLLRGCDYSWTVVWKYLGFPEAVHKAAMRDYLKCNTTYQEWCDVACAHFRSKNLRRNDFPKIVSGLKITNNFESTITALKAAGFILAIMSGGIDTFIEETIPNATQLFDYICINRLQFEQTSGLISGVEATPFDFEGKAVALEAICQRHGCTLKEAVFVGEGFNDETAVNKAGLSIAYPPGETAIDAASRVIPEDDLSKILPHVL
jgi:phosphoserine phosphatase/pimeloyl-ACP methyl ester carboxylesterase